MAKVSTYGSFTPILTDLLYGVDDPGGVPASGKMTLADVRTLLQANFTTLTASTSLAIGGNATLTAPSANVLELANGTTAQTLRVFNTRTDINNGEWGAMRWNSNILEIGSFQNGTGSAQIVRIVRGGTAKILVNSGDIRIASDLVPEAGPIRALGSDARPWDDFFVGGKASFKSRGELTIATGAVSIFGTKHTVDTEGDASTDDLDTINGGTDGTLLILSAADSARTVVCKDGTGNLALAGDFSLDNVQDRIVLQYDLATTTWCEISRSDNGA